MGRKRRKTVKRKVVKPPPKVFLCPVCNMEAVTVQREDEEYARVACGNCGASARMRWYPAYTTVDAYAEFYDIVTGVKKPVEVAVEGGGEIKKAGEGGGKEVGEDVSEDRED